MDHFDDAHDALPPWETGQPQPAIVDIDDAFDGPVLDVGCGTGEHALYAAARGHDAWGVDSSSRAIERARGAAQRRGLAAATTFRVHDVFALATLNRRFGTVLDAGLFHAFDPADHRRYADAVATALESGGRLYLLCLSERDPHSTAVGPRRVREADLHSAFDDGWTVESVESAPLEWRYLPRPREAYLATVRRRD